MCYRPGFDFRDYLKESPHNGNKLGINCSMRGRSHTFPLVADPRPQDTEDGALPQVGGASPSTGGRSQSRRAEAVPVRRETLPRPLHRQQAQLVRTMRSPLSRSLRMLSHQDRLVLDWLVQDQLGQE